jgi:ATP-dependent DNA helicase RecG
LFGAKQHGLPEFRFFDAERDEPLLIQAREDARALIQSDPGLERPEHEPFRQVLADRYGERQRLYETG